MRAGIIVLDDTVRRGTMTLLNLLKVTLYTIIYCNHM